MLYNLPRTGKSPSRSPGLNGAQEWDAQDVDEEGLQLGREMRLCEAVCGIRCAVLCSFKSAWASDFRSRLFPLGLSCGVYRELLHLDY